MNRADITTALLNHAKPSVPSPENWVTCPRPDTALVPKPLIDFAEYASAEGIPMDPRFDEVLDNLGVLNQFAEHAQRRGLHYRNSWAGQEHFNHFIDPVAHALMSLGESQTPVRALEPVIEALRLGSIIWIILLKRECDSYPSTSSTYVSRLLGILEATPARRRMWKGSQALRVIRLWLLVICGISGLNGQLYSVVRGSLAGELCGERRPRTWHEVMTMVRQMPWLDLFELPSAQLEQQIRTNFLLEKDFGCMADESRIVHD